MKPLSSVVLADEILSSKVALETPIHSLTHSSSDVNEGSIFFALSGGRFDGHGFVADALKKKASVIVVEREEVFRENPNSILVTSTRELLGKAASRWFDCPTSKFQLVGITGTNGKTTTTFILKHLWEKAGRVPGVVGTVEYFMGELRESSSLTTPDPITLQRLFHQMVQFGVSHAAIEVSSIALNQHRVEGCEFDVALFTNLTQDHLDYHGNFENYFRAKRALFEDYKVPCAVINCDDEWGKRLLREIQVARKVVFSAKQEGADFSVLASTHGMDGIQARIKTPEGVLECVFPLIGRHNVYNVLGALAVVWSLGGDLHAAGGFLADVKAAPGRLERVVSSKGFPYVFVDYAHSDDALKNVLSSLTETNCSGSGRIITVFGCGGDRDRLKRPKMAEVVSRYSDVTIATSDNPRTEQPEAILDDIEKGILRERTRYIREADRTSAIHQALEIATENDIVLVAGKGHETYQIIGTRRFSFDDREIIREYYKKKS